MSQTIDTRSRRALLASGLAALGAGIAATFGRSAPARAEGEGMVVGGEYFTATSRTYLKNAANNDDVFVAVTTGTGKGVWGKNDGGGTGVYGQVTNAGYGVQGIADLGIGVAGTSVSNFGVFGSSTATFGVYGTSVSSAGVKGTSDRNFGVVGVSTSGTGVTGSSGTGHGVEGFTATGFAISGIAFDSGFALATRGRVLHTDISGVATIPIGKTSVTVHTYVNVVPAAFVLLTPNANLGTRSLWYTTKPATDAITIHISTARTSATRIAWLLLG
jgi:hypothetical protein